VGETHDSILSDVSRAMVALHKEQFGRGPTKARTSFGGPDLMVTVLYDALLPAEKALAEMGEIMRVLEARAFFEESTRERFIQVIEQTVYRKVHSFHSTCDPRTGIVMEISLFEPRESGGNDDPGTA
jgi:uncharacterized protein YbcI